MLGGAAHQQESAWGVCTTSAGAQSRQNLVKDACVTCVRGREECSPVYLAGGSRLVRADLVQVRHLKSAAVGRQLGCNNNARRAKPG